MKFTIRRVNPNSLLITRSGYTPKIISFEEFFNVMKSDVDRKGYVESVSFENSTICMNQVHQYVGFRYKCEVLIDSLLLADENFFAKLTEFLEYCNDKKEELHEEAEKKYHEVNFDYNAKRKAKEIYQEYCETGRIKPITSLELVERIIKLCREKNSEVYKETIDTLDGGRSYIYYNNLKTKILDKVQIVSLMASVVLGTALISITSKMGTPADSTLATGTIVSLGASCIGTGALSYLSSRISEKEKNTESFKTLDEIANILEEEYFSNEINQAHTL